MALAQQTTSEHPDYDLGRAMAAAIRRYAGQVVREVARDAMTAAPNWRASLEHLQEYVSGQIGGLAGRVNTMDQRIRQLETLAAEGVLGRRLEVVDGDTT